MYTSTQTNLSLFFFSTARFTEKTPHQTLISGKPGVLNCSAEGAPAPWFTWSKTDGKALIKERFKLLPNGNMHVRFAITEDQGKYICTINQNKGTKRTTSKPQYLDVSVIGKKRIASIPFQTY